MKSTLQHEDPKVDQSELYLKIVQGQENKVEWPSHHIRHPTTAAFKKHQKLIPSSAGVKRPLDSASMSQCMQIIPQ